MGQPSGFVCKFVRFCALLFLIGSSTAWGQVRPRVVQAVSNEQRVTLKGNVHPLARAEFDRGAAVESQPMTRMLLLLKRGDDQEAALQQYLESQQDKSSPNYHAWLTPEEFGANYGPADADVQAVTDWLTSQGFTVEKVYSGKTVIEFSGTAGGVQRAFGTAIRNFEIGGKTYLANAERSADSGGVGAGGGGDCLAEQLSAAVASARGRASSQKSWQTGIGAAADISLPQR